MENKFTQKMAQHLVDSINVYARKEGLELQKMVLGMEILLLNISKLIIIYVLAYWCGILDKTFIIHASFALVKRYSFGLHALNSTVCTLVSCCLFVVIPLLISDVGIHNKIVIAIFPFIIFALYRYAPADTKARPLIGTMLRKSLKKKAVVCGVVVMAIALLIPNESIKLLLVLGAVYQSIFILPLTYKILKRSERNYEEYERN